MLDMLSEIMRRAIVAIIAALAALAIACLPVAAQQAEQDPEFSLWLVQVQHHHRADAPADPASDAQLEQLSEQLAAATKPADKRRLQREIDEITEKRDKDRGYIIYGYSIYADDQGKPVDQTRHMAGFVLPASAENAKAVAALKPDMALAINKTGATALFAFGGRRWHIAERAAAVKSAATFESSPKFKVPPKDAITDPKLMSLKTSLSHNHTKPRDAGGELIRYSLNIKSENPKATASTLDVWFNTTVLVDGRVIGPILEHAEVPRGKSGGFSMSRSFEFITKPGVTLDDKATSATPVAMAWK